MNGHKIFNEITTRVYLSKTELNNNCYNLPDIFNLTYLSNDLLECQIFM